MIQRIESIYADDDLSVLNFEASDGRDGSGADAFGGLGFDDGRQEGPGGLKDQGTDGGPNTFPPAPDEIWGTRYDDWMDFAHRDEDTSYYGFAGNDDIFAGNGDENMFGGLGDDYLSGASGNDTLVGGDGNDFLSGGDDADEIHAGQGADDIMGGHQDDTIFLVDDGDVDKIIYEQGDATDIVDNFELGVDQFLLGFGFNFANFAEVEAHITYNDMGDQAMLDLGGGDVVYFTQLDGVFEAGDFGF